MQVPPEFGRLQCSQVPLHELSQHTPSRQFPLAQATPLPHALPAKEPRQAPEPSQTSTREHSLSESWPSETSVHVPTEPG
ncbi:MAG: hypothetical protein OEM05_15360, partial [Myxococcales bacterium]|nr:hypothetical protein [Myxococcales bacterium]